MWEERGGRRRGREREREGERRAGVFFFQLLFYGFPREVKCKIIESYYDEES